MLKYKVGINAVIANFVCMWKSLSVSELQANATLA